MTEEREKQEAELEKQARELIRGYYENPENAMTVRLAIGRRKRCGIVCIGMWSEKEQRFQARMAHVASGEWFWLPFEVLVNGQVPVIEWTEVTRLEAVECKGGVQ